MSRCYDNPDYDDSESDIQNTWEHQYRYEQKKESKVMKNIHILPTDKPTWLHKSLISDQLRKSSSCIDDMKQAQGLNIYITSDEEIKEGDYVLYEGEVFKVLQTGIMYNDDFTIRVNDEYTFINDKYSLKIILTTDQDLIKDGVQAIDDEFLEWFVKNPSCEEVEVEKDYSYGNLEHFDYKIIIPKEEPKIYTQDDYFNDEFPKEEPKKNFYCGDEVDYDDKCLEQCDRCVDATGVDYGYLPEDSKQNIIDMMKGDEELGLYDEIQPEQIWNEEKKKGIKQLIQDHKKETLEEVAERILHRNEVADGDMIMSRTFPNTIKSMVEMAKWQQERSYSEEDMIEFNEWVSLNFPNQHNYLRALQKHNQGLYVPKEKLVGYYSTKELFEKFKKK